MCVILFICPAISQYEGRILWLPLSGKDALLVAVGAEDAFSRLEISEIPYQFSLDEIIGIEYFKILIKIFVLVFLRPHDTWQLVFCCQGICTEFRKDKRHIEFLGLPALRH